MAPVLHNIIKRIFTSGEFGSTIGSPLATKDDPLFDFFSMQIPSDLLTIVDRNNYTASGSIGKGNRLHSYWFALFDKNITISAAKGVYIVYLLSFDGERLYLTLNQGSDGVDNLNVKGLRQRAGSIAAQLSNIGNFDVGPVNLEDNAKGRTLNFSVGSIFSKEYKKTDSIPSEESLRKDLFNMLSIYGEYAAKNGFRSEEFCNGFGDAPKENIGVDEMRCCQKIFFGAPGTGKSFKVNQLVDNAENVFRTTFHPDYDYAQFVGSYKPTKDAISSSLTYSFIPQVFAKACVAAYKNPDKPVYLVIEEINRGNCAQIFGDIFQLLDRDDEGYSRYEIDADADFAEWLESQIPDQVRNDARYPGKGKLRLPPNFNILATMNTSDQSLFPMDSAFKRRFDWEYVPIAFKNDDGSEKSAAKFEVEVGNEKYRWQAFVENVNKKIEDLTESEDKQLGEYFIQPDKKAKDDDAEKTVISEDRFKGKVMFYLWNEVCKDEHKNGSFFKVDGKYFTFQELYKDPSKLSAFMKEMTKTTSSEQ